MGARGIVSLWFGKAASEEAFFDALEVSFSRDGDFRGSTFSKAFGIGYYDDATREAEFWESPPASLEEMLRGASYDDVVIRRFSALDLQVPAEANCMVLLYDHHHEGRGEWATKTVTLKFLGAVPYR